MRASDSQEGSRVALTADQSLNDYEAYRRGDRFYVKIPPADVPRAEAVRGRAFSDVKVNRSADSTIVSFHLQPGASAHVEQRGNKLDVVIAMPGARSVATKTRSDAGPAPPSDNKRKLATNTVTAKNQGSNTLTAKKNENSSKSQAVAAAKPSPTPKLAASPVSSPAIAALKSSPTPQATKPLSTVVQTKTSSTPAQAATNVPQGDLWSRFKERARYWLLVAQLNPVPVAIGVAILLLLIGLLVLQRRRARATRRARFRKTVSKSDSKSDAPAAPDSADSKSAEISARGAVISSAAVATETGAASQNGKGERASHVSDEVRKLMTGDNYDESLIGSGDRETRQLVGAELLSALVGRNPERRERAREAFMKHGYFDDATRDLRVAESANDRAAAARRLSFVRDREATPHLIAALDDSSPDVRRAAVEALLDLRDPSAIAPLNSLMQTETDRKVPRSLIKHAIDACATSAPEEIADVPSRSSFAPHVVSQSAESDREVIEI